MPEQQSPLISVNYDIETQKPLTDIQLLLQYLMSFSNNLETTNRQVINYRQNGVRQCFLLHEGSVSLYRKFDGMALNTESAPFVFGMSTQLTDSDYLFLRAHESAKISCLSFEEAEAIIDKNNLWQSLSQLLIYTVSRVYDHCTKISALSSYEVLRYQLYELMSEPEDVRNKVTIASYVQSRTFLSRSSIMKILAQLKKGGYIVTDKGLLLSINNIPLKY